MISNKLKSAAQMLFLSEYNFNALSEQSAWRNDEGINQLIDFYAI